MKITEGLLIVCTDASLNKALLCGVDEASKGAGKLSGVARTVALTIRRSGTGVTHTRATLKK